jgi:sulfoxide reductase heme-binding subunit YedZ
MNRLLLNSLCRRGVLCAGLLPFLWLLAAALTDRLGANPAEQLIRSTGDWTLRFLCLVLAVTPIRSMAGWPALAGYRRMLGLYVYFYALLHLLGYAWFDMGFELQTIATDIAKRPFILVGFTALVVLTPMALTSNQRAIRWLGAIRWQRLHRLVYLVAPLVILHFFWMRAAKKNFSEVYVYGAILATLLAWRIWHRLRRRRTTGRSAKPRVANGPASSRPGDAGASG